MYTPVGLPKILLSGSLHRGVAEVSFGIGPQHRTYFGVSGGERLQKFPRDHLWLRTAGTPLLRSLNIIIGWGCWDIVSGVAEASSS